jgi:UDP-glucose 4-epimerase
MRILITGGAGFVGSHLADELLSRGHSVHSLDDLSTGAIDNIRHLRHHRRFEYTIDSCHNSRLVAELVDEADIVYHLAAAVGVELIVESPVRTIETNIGTTEVVLAHAGKKRKPVFVTSTSEVYGKSTALPFREDGDLLMGPTFKGRWAYACSKAIDEFLALAYYKERGLPVVIGRMFNTVGPRQTGRYGMVVPNFVGSAIADRPLRVYGDGSQSRCFSHVEDVVRALADLMESGRFYGEIFNIGTDAEITIAQLAEKVRELVGSSSPITYVPYEEAYEEGFEDMQRRIPDTTKVREAIGWIPKKSLDDIILDVRDHQVHERDSRLRLAA